MTLDSDHRYVMRVPPALLQGYSLEVSSRDVAVAEQLRRHVLPGTDIFITALPGDDCLHTVDTARSIRQAGFNPVPHIAARNIASKAQLDEFLARLTEVANVTRAFVIAGDVDRPAGPFPSSIDLFESGLFQKYKIKSLGISGYPEGHTKIDQPSLQKALERKIELAMSNDFDLWITTQFCFESAPILQWLRMIRERGISLPVRIGVAGPTKLAALLKFAVRCGIGNSIRALRARTDMVARLLRDVGPEEILSQLASAIDQSQLSGISGIHFFIFGGIPKTMEWITRVQGQSPLDESLRTSQQMPAAGAEFNLKWPQR